jgi:hypothetical protein
MMIVDRRLAAAAVLAAGLIVVTAAVIADRPNGDRAALPTTLAQATSRDSTVLASVPVDPVPVVRPEPSTVPPAPPTSTPTSPPPVDADVELLVRLQRPVPDPTPHVDDGHGDDHGAPATASAEHVAALTAVAMWSWRFDDPPTRLVDALAALATPELIAGLSPSPTERARRRDAGEVAWAIVTAGPTVTERDVAGEVLVDLGVSQHVTTANSAEVVVARTASLRLRVIAGRWQVIQVVQP